MPYEKVRTEQLKSLLDRLKEQIYKPLTDLKVTAWVTEEPVSYEDRESGRKIELAAGDRWGNLWDCAWFHFSGKVPQEAKGSKIVLLIDVNGELCLVDEEGTPTQGLTNINSEFDYSLGLPGKRVVHISESAQGDEEIDLWGDAGCNDLFGRFRSGTLKEAQVAICHENIHQLYYDAEVLLETADRLPEGSARRARILQSLYEASHILTSLSEERVAKASKLLREQLDKRGGDSVLTISAVGHAHMDLAWLWPIRETIRKGARTFSTVLRMMERYPDYIFGASQPQLYDWMKIHYPKLYASIKERVQEGRWELQGAMWVESDTNVPSGEALIRQILYGKRYFQAEFGQEMKSLWMPDVFGYTASLPQILKKSGVDYMMTQKLSWSIYNRHPHHTFHWEGIDCSRVLTHMPPEDTYNSPAAPRSIVKAENEYMDKNVSENCLMLFGIGDGGGGPGEEHLERLQREKNLLGLSPVVQEHSSQFFEKLAVGSDRYQVWSGELYLERHQGTLTSQARNKRYNRKLEKALRELEYAAVLAERTKGKPYPAQELETIWKEVLLYQFHDILPGSSIKRVYDESLERYAILLDRVEQLISEAYEAVAQSVTAEKGSEVIFNSLSWDREEWIENNGTWQRVRIPAMGYAVANGSLALAETAAAEAGIAAARTQEKTAANNLFPDMRSSAIDRIMENDLLSVTFAEDFTIISIIDKELGREIIPHGQKANELSLYHDEGDAWDIKQDYRLSGGVPLEPSESSAFQDGPTVGLLLVYRFGQSTMTQKVILTQGSRRIDFVTDVDWKESAKMLRTSFPVNIRSDSASCEIQFGYLKRPTHRNTLWDYAKDEICAHQWIDLSESDYGVALLNDCKYGHRAWQNVLDLNLLRSTSYPDPEADQAEHQFTYSLYPHKGDHVQAEVYKRGYELNVPLRSVSMPASDEAQYLPAAKSFFSVDHSNVMVETVKQAEDGDDLIIRLYETAGTHLKAKLIAAMNEADAWLTDLMETPIDRIHAEEGAYHLAFTPFEIKTIRLARR
ncbi:alpha-mannosidase [Paenibacillus sp. FSL A5-0031]|uniref:alpha-mannosidase n=1 Tax=Paenibacillus sp. FSL A5-0031 TaxID=1920420 RepID=UPI00096D4069|nr:glycoside hydrolase family 38 C-terminal domain-containing protein [Paenibacillus sp. FSL A5-0031]OME80682.1 alpha-mannosidase [Paenibacillus sp. FSL A5-0031]